MGSTDVDVREADTASLGAAAITAFDGGGAIAIPGLPLESGIGTFKWSATTKQMRDAGFEEPLHAYDFAREAFLVVGDVTFDAKFVLRHRGLTPSTVRLEARAPEGASPNAPLSSSHRWWQSLTALSQWLGGPPLPLADSSPMGALESGRPYVGSGTMTWRNVKADITVTLLTNRLEHIARFDIVGPRGPERRPRGMLI